MIPQEMFNQSIRRYFHNIVPLLDDDSVSEIMINGPNEVWIEVKGKIYQTDIVFQNEDELHAAVKNVAQFVGRPLDDANPILAARLPDGSRVQVVLPPSARQGIVVSIRRFSKNTLTPKALVEYQSISQNGLEFIKLCVEQKENIIVAGGTGSGKTSLLNALSSFIAQDDRIIVIEDASELQLQQPHLVLLETRPANSRGEGEVTIADLFKSALRLRPDRIVIGEIRGGEALDMIQAMTTGHGGSMSTTHATYPADTLRRIETMAMMSDVQMPLHALRAQIGSAIGIIVQTSRFNDGSRKITHIEEVLGVDENNDYLLRPIFRYSNGSFSPTGLLPSFFEALPEEKQIYVQSLVGLH